MSIFPGNVLVIDDQFNLCYDKEPEEYHKKIQWQNFIRLKTLFDNNGFCYSIITDITNIDKVKSKIKKYQNIRLLILDLDLDESGDIEDADIALVKIIIRESLATFGYFFLVINSSYADKWKEIKKEMIQEHESSKVKKDKEIHFLDNFCISLNKSLPEIEEQILELLIKRFSNEIITQFEVYLNNARDKALAPFLDFETKTWDYLYHVLFEDVHSHEQVNLTINGFLFGLLKQHMISANYSVPQNEKPDSLDPDLHKSIIRGFSYTDNIENKLNDHPVWMGNLYLYSVNPKNKEYILVITPECDLAQSKGNGYTIIHGFEIDFPKDYKPENYKDKEPPFMIESAGKNNKGEWKSANEIKQFYEGAGFYSLLHASTQNKHIILDLRSVTTVATFNENYKLVLRINEPIITDIMDKYSTIYNRKGIPRITSKKYFQIS